MCIYNVVLSYDLTKLPSIQTSVQRNRLTEKPVHRENMYSEVHVHAVGTVYYIALHILLVSVWC